MPRTESVAFQCHPDAEQDQIRLMEKFGWSLLSTQTIDTKDNRLEVRGGALYQVTERTTYVKLSFQRDLDLPHLAEIRQIESEFFAIQDQEPPSLFPILGVLSFILCFPGWLLYFFLSYRPRKAAYDLAAKQNKERRGKLLKQVAQYL